jgi:hypothetical protein
MVAVTSIVAGGELTLHCNITPRVHADDVALLITPYGFMDVGKLNILNITQLCAER